MSREDLRADCTRCAALCCVATSFETSVDFACDKPRGRPCVHLGADHRCAIHDRRRELGFSGCIAYDCYGAGQHLTRTLLRGGSWRDGGDIERLCVIFSRTCELHEMLAALELARTFAIPPGLCAEIEACAARLEALRQVPERIAAADVQRERRAFDAILAVLRAAHSGAPPANVRF